MRLRGFDDFRRKLDRLANAAEKLDGTHHVTLDQVLHPLFMLENTGFGSIGEFFDGSPFKVTSQADFEAIDEAGLDAYVREKTRFQSWDEMRTAAAQEWLARRLHEEVGE